MNTIVKAVLTVREVMAVEAVIKGIANPDQQRLASDWLMREAARVTDLPYFQDDPSGRSDAFASGRMYVGILWRQMLLPTTLQLAKAHDDEVERGLLLKARKPQ